MKKTMNNGLFFAEKENVNTFVGMIYALAIAVAVGLLLLAAFPKIGKQVTDGVQAGITKTNTAVDQAAPSVVKP